MKGKGLTALAMAIMLGVSAVQPVWAADWQKGNTLIAHAFGEVNNKIETNSKEAFINAWENGFRVVEGDFTYTSDGIKDCSGCLRPHRRENYGDICEKLKLIMEMAKKQP